MTDAPHVKNILWVFSIARLNSEIWLGVFRDLQLYFGSQTSFVELNHLYFKDREKHIVRKIELSKVGIFLYFFVPLENRMGIHALRELELPVFDGIIYMFTDHLHMDHTFLRENHQYLCTEEIEGFISLLRKSMASRQKLLILYLYRENKNYIPVPNIPEEDFKNLMPPDTTYEACPIEDMGQIVGLIEKHFAKSDI